MLQGARPPSSQCTPSSFLGGQSLWRPVLTQAMARERSAPPLGPAAQGPGRLPLSRRLSIHTCTEDTCTSSHHRAAATRGSRDHPQPPGPWEGLAIEIPTCTGRTPPILPRAERARGSCSSALGTAGTFWLCLPPGTCGICPFLQLRSRPFLPLQPPAPASCSPSPAASPSSSPGSSRAPGTGDTEAQHLGPALRDPRHRHRQPLSDSWNPRCHQPGTRVLVLMCTHGAWAAPAGTSGSCAHLCRNLLSRAHTCPQPSPLSSAVARPADLRPGTILVQVSSPQDGSRITQNPLGEGGAAGAESLG